MHEDYVVDLLSGRDIEVAVSLPCDRTKHLCALLEHRFRYLTLCREEDGIGICSGLALTGTRAVLQMQSSGLGNSLNALLTLPSLYRLPLPVIASWRGVYRESIPAQLPFNTGIPRLLALYGIAHTLISGPDDIDLIKAAVDDAYARCRPHIALLSPKVWEGDAPDVMPCIPQRRHAGRGLVHDPVCGEPVMRRADAIRELSSIFTDEIVVCNIGIPCRELYAAGDRPENFYMLGSYTQASPLGLGISLGTPRDVVVIDGDGSMLGTAVLPTVVAESPRNLTLVCLDNGVFGSTGNQRTPASLFVDMELQAKAAGFMTTRKVYTPDDLIAAWHETRGQGPVFLHVVIKPGNSQVPNIPLGPEMISQRIISLLRQSPVQDHGTTKTIRSPDRAGSNLPEFFR